MRARKQSALRRTRLRVAYKYPATAAKASRRFSLSSPSHASSHRYLTLEIIQRRPAVLVGDHHCLLAHDRISVRASRRQKRIGHRFSHFKCFIMQNVLNGVGLLVQGQKPETLSLLLMRSPKIVFFFFPPFQQSGGSAVEASNSFHSITFSPL